jgi:outer membrane biosynthesis protein TonB
VSTDSRLVAGRFRLIRRLGAGAMASVFLAEDVELGRRVAIKRLHPDSGAEVAPRFRREMRVAASLSHPNVVKVFDAIEHEGAVLLVMEYVDGPSLAQRMGDGPLPPDEALAILRPLAGAVDHLHAQGVIHRDVKPANVMLDNEDRVKLTDLGIASAAQATGITTTGTILGTPAYMAPEMFDGDRATDAADVYSVAAIAFEMLTGRRAREGGTPAVVAMRAATQPPPDVRDVWPEAAALAAAIAHGMARDPAERPPSATALVDEIAAALETDADAPVGAAEVAPPAPAEPPRTEPAPPEPVRTEPAPPAPVRAEPAPPAPVRAEPAPPEPVRAEPARPAPAPSPPPRRERRSPAVLVAAAAAVLALAAIAAVLLTGGGSDPERGASSTPRSTTTGGRTASTSSTHASTAGTAAAVPAPTSPTGAVQAFYGRAAAHRYNDAWALAGPGLRQQLGGFAAFRRQFSTVRSIVFSRASEVRRTDSGATVAVATTATHTDHVDHCAGTADTLPAAGGGWVVAHIAITC